VAAGSPALIHEGRTVTYGELARLARAFAGLLRAAGIEPGDRVAIALPNGADFVAAYFGTLRVGAIAVPVNILLRPGEIDERVAAVGASLIVTDPAHAGELDGVSRTNGIPSLVLGPSTIPDGAALDELAPRRESDPAVILFTSGTSGKSKGAILTHGSIRAAARNAAEALSFGPRDVVLGAAPFSHVLGQSTGLVATLESGGCVAIVPRFEPNETLALMVETGTTILLGVPTMCIALCEAGRTAVARPPLRIAHVGGAPLPVEVTREFERTFGADVYEGYGLTEVSGIATTYRAGQLRKEGSVGLPLGDSEVRIVSIDGVDAAPGEIGEVLFRGSSVISGYWGVPQDATDGWLATGDLGYLDSDGYLFLVDRLKEMIIRGGYNIYPREVEETLYGHPDVLAVAVVGIPHPSLGEEVVALVQPRPNSSLDPEQLREWARERLAAYKYPRHVVLVDRLPVGPTGKILKREIDRDALRRGLTF